MKILPNEIRLTGRWVLRNGRLVADEVCARIEDLKRGHLRELGHDKTGWDTLFVDPDDGRLWELIYPESGLHGGGAPELQHLTKEEAKNKYKAIFSGNSGDAILN